MPSSQILAISCLFLTTFCDAQIIPERQPDGGGEYNFAHSDEITPAQRNAIIAMLQGNKQQLEKAGKWQAPVEQVTGFQWPIRQKTGINYNGFYGISNYVDENPAYPNQVLDYN